MEHSSIIIQKKRIRNLGFIFVAFLIIAVALSIVDFGSDFIAGWIAESPGSEIERINESDVIQEGDRIAPTVENPFLCEDNHVVKIIVSFIYCVSIIFFIVYVLKTVTLTVKNDSIDDRVEKCIMKIGVCLVLIGISGSIWTTVLFKEFGNGSNLVILMSGIVFILLSEVFRLARLYKTDSELSI